MRITIPTSLSEITLKQWQDYNRVITQTDITDEIERFAMVTLFCKIEDVKQIPIKELNEIYQTVKDTLKQEPKFTQRFIIDGIEYGFIPNLDEMTAGEYIDLDNYLSDIETYHNAMAVMYRPVKRKSMGLYSIEDYQSSDKYKDVMLEVPLDIVLGSLVFFWNLSKDLLKATSRYLHDPKTQTQIHDLGINGDGIKAFTQSATAMHTNLKRPNALTYIPSLRS